MSRIYDALKKLEAERHGRRANGGNGGHGGNGGNGGGRNGGNGGNGGGNGNGKRRNWRRLFGNGNGHKNGHPHITLSLDLGPDAEDAYQRLGTNLLVPGAAESAAAPRLLGVTASRHGEGTTTTAAVFASILVRRRGGRVAVVEANLRSPSFDAVFGIRRDGGFSELIQGERPLGEVALPTEVPNLFAIGCGHSNLGPSALFDSPGLAAALDQLRANFDFVIFDLPPANVYGDTSILGPRLDAAMVVIEADRTRIPEVERARRSLERVGVKIVGSVLNRRRNYIPAFLEEML
ncbi:MAG TPA: CpsD/CapB family tyrosine-protein kinase [Candidatus Binatia bacterium]|nr:CpsD/CapB family tyrosine-protein kinase [Candidatus Binatia bacterium]